MRFLQPPAVRKAFAHNVGSYGDRANWSDAGASPFLLGFAPMPEPATAFALLPFEPLPPAVRRITGQVLRNPEGLQVSFLLEGEMARLSVPSPRTPGPADGLWRHTCFELFVARPEAPGYLEFNFSPSGEWAVYAFERYRERVPLDDGLVAAAAPVIEVHGTEDTLRLDATAPLARLAPGYARAGLVLGLAAVVESRDAAPPLSHWALRHPCARPDFHHRDAFILELDEIRN
ncbi:MAG: DOMON-like domain-containing protein [Thiohalomonadaceae bacterium]